MTTSKDDKAPATALPTSTAPTPDPSMQPVYLVQANPRKVDDEIDGLEGDVQVRGETLYQGGASDPVDPCEDF